MYEYRVNVSQQGSHLFNVALPLGTTKSSAITAARDIASHYPEPKHRVELMESITTVRAVWGSKAL